MKKLRLPRPLIVRRSCPGPFTVKVLVSAIIRDPPINEIVRITLNTVGSKLMSLAFVAEAFVAATASRKEQSALQTPSFVSAIFVTTNVSADTVVVRNKQRAKN